MIQYLHFGVALAFLFVSLAGIAAGVAMKLQERPTFKETDERLKALREELRERAVTREDMGRFEFELKLLRGELQELKEIIEYLVEKLNE